MTTVDPAALLAAVGSLPPPIGDPLKPYVVDSGLPRHLPVGLDKDGNGPCEPDEDPFRYTCWCTDDQCMWKLVLAFNAEQRAAS